MAFHEQLTLTYHVVPLSIVMESMMFFMSTLKLAWADPSMTPMSVKQLTLLTSLLSVSVSLKFPDMQSKSMTMTTNACQVH